MVSIGKLEFVATLRREIASDFVSTRRKIEKALKLQPGTLYTPRRLPLSARELKEVEEILLSLDLASEKVRALREFLRLSRAQFITIAISVLWGVILTQKMMVWALDAVETASFSQVAQIPLWIPYFIAVIGLGGFALATLLLFLHLIVRAIHQET